MYACQDKRDSERGARENITVSQVVPAARDRVLNLQCCGYLLVSSLATRTHSSHHPQVDTDMQRGTGIFNHSLRGFWKAVGMTSIAMSSMSIWTQNKHGICSLSSWPNLGRQSWVCRGTTTASLLPDIMGLSAKRLTESKSWKLGDGWQPKVAD